MQGPADESSGRPCVAVCRVPSRASLPSRAQRESAASLRPLDDRSRAIRMHAAEAQAEVSSIVKGVGVLRPSHLRPSERLLCDMRTDAAMLDGGR